MYYVVHRKGFIIIVFEQIHFIRRKKFNVTNVNSHKFYI